ncbi:MAG: hypothetical protein WC378_04485 [Opitutaceae bacterium]|jgi:hypothetical protein
MPNTPLLPQLPLFGTVDIAFIRTSAATGLLAMEEVAQTAAYDVNTASLGDLANLTLKPKAEYSEPQKKSVRGIKVDGPRQLSGMEITAEIVLSELTEALFQAMLQAGEGTTGEDFQEYDPGSMREVLTGYVRIRWWESKDQVKPVVIWQNQLMEVTYDSGDESGKDKPKMVEHKATLKALYPFAKFRVRKNRAVA